MPSAELLPHAIAATLLLVLSAILLRDVRAGPAGRYGAAFAFGSAAFALASAPGFTGAPMAVRAPVAALATANVVAFWLFARALFDDAFRAGARHGLCWLILAGISALHCLLAPVLFGTLPYGPVIDLVSIGFIAAGLVPVVAGWRSDLVEGRRRLRLYVVCAAGAYGLIYCLLRLVMRSPDANALPQPFDGLALLAVVVAAVLLLTRADDDVVAAAGPPSQDVPLPATAPAAPAGGPDRRLVEALDRLMSEQRAYREDGLTIGKLALRLGVPDYRLRRLINQHLGHRNFNAFLNGYRIREAQAALADPEQVDVPVTTIALDAGFASIGPFNRAFKVSTGTTPTAFRQAARSGRPQAQPVNSAQTIDIAS